MELDKIDTESIVTPKQMNYFAIIDANISKNNFFPLSKLFYTILSTS